MPDNCSRRAQWAPTSFLLISVLFALIPSAFAIPEQNNYYSFVRQWASAGSADGQLLGPTSIVLDSKGNSYIADSGNHRIQKFTSDGQFITKWGSFCSLKEKTDDCIDPDGPGPLSVGDGQFESISDMAIDNEDNLYVSDFGNHRIQKFTSDGQFITKWGSFGSGDGQFVYPAGIAFNANNASIFVVSEGDGHIQKFTTEGHFVTKWGSFGSGDGQICGPHDIETDRFGNIYIDDSWNDRIEKFTSDGQFITKWQLDSSEKTPDCNSPHRTGIFVEYGTNNVFVADPTNRLVMIYTGDGKLITKLMPDPTKINDKDYYDFLMPWDLASDKLGNLQIVDIADGNIKSFKALNNIAMQEKTDPRIVTPASPIKTEASDQSGANVFYDVNLAANATGFNPVACTPESGSLFPRGITLVTCSTTGLDSETAISTFIVNVTDTTPPLIVPPQDVKVTVPIANNSGVPSDSVYLGIPAIADIVDPSPSVTNNLPKSLAIGTNIVTWTAIDSSGNVARANQTIVISLEGSTPDVNETAIYGNSYEKSKNLLAIVNESNPFVIQSQYNLYKPGQIMKLSTQVLADRVSGLPSGSLVVIVKVLDQNGQAVFGPASAIIDPSNGSVLDGMVLSIPSQIQRGVYKIDAKLDLSIDKIKSLSQNQTLFNNVQGLINLKSGQYIVISSPDPYRISEEGKQFEVKIASSGQIDSIRFNKNEKRIAFDESSSVTPTVSEISIPKDLLGGQLRVSVDGIDAEPDSVIIKEDDSTGQRGLNSNSILEVNLSPGKHTIEIFGTSVVPEFPSVISFAMFAFLLIILVGSFRFLVIHRRMLGNL